MAGADGRLWFDEQGSLNLSEWLPLETILGELVERLSLFLARMESCERTESDDYSLASRNAGTLGGARILWHNVLLVAGSARACMLPPPSPEHLAALEREGVAGFQDGPVCFARAFLPTADALHQLTFAILENETGEWRGTIPERTVARIRGIRAEVALYLQTFPAREAQRVHEAISIRANGSGKSTSSGPPAETRAYAGFQLACEEREDLSTRTPGPAHHKHLRETHPELLEGKALTNCDTWRTQARKGRLLEEGRIRGIQKQPTRSVVRQNAI